MLEFQGVIGCFSYPEVSLHIVSVIISYFCLPQTLPRHLSFLLSALLFIQAPHCIFLLFPLPRSLLVDFLSCDSPLRRVPSKTAHTRPHLESQVR